MGRADQTIWRLGHSAYETPVAAKGRRLVVAMTYGMMMSPFAAHGRGRLRQHHHASMPTPATSCPSRIHGEDQQAMVPKQKHAARRGWPWMHSTVQMQCVGLDSGLRKPYPGPVRVPWARHGGRVEPSIVVHVCKRPCREPFSVIPMHAVRGASATRSERAGAHHLWPYR